MNPNTVLTVHVPLPALVALLGEPNPPADEDKSHVEWRLDTPDGPVDVYDYGDSHDCPGRDCHRDPRAADARTAWEWHVNAPTQAAARLVTLWMQPS